MNSLIKVRMFSESMISFRKFCLVSNSLPTELHLKFVDIAAKAGNLIKIVLIKIIVNSFKNT